MQHLGLFQTLWAVGAATVAVINHQNEKMLQVTINAETEQLLDYINEMNSLHMVTSENTLKDLADNPNIISLLKNKDKESFDIVNEKLTDIPLINKQFNNLALYDNNCILRGASEISQYLIGQNFSERDYCKGITKTKQTYVSGALFGVVSKKPILTISVPVKNENGEMIGFIFGSISLEYLSESVTRLQQSGSYVIMLDRYDEVFLNTHELVTQLVSSENQTKEEVNLVVQSLKAGKNKDFFKFSQKSGRTDYVGYKKYDYITIIFDKPYEEAFGIVNQTSNAVIIALFAALIVLLVSSWIISGIILKPISRLKNDVEKITKGNIDLQLEGSNISEISELTTSLNRILSSMKLAILRTGMTKEELGLGEAIAAKEIAEEKYKALFDSAVDAIFIADPATRQLIDCNKAAEALIGHTRDEILSMKADELHPKDKVEETMKGFKEQAEGKIKTLFSEVLTKDNRRIPVAISAATIVIGDKTYIQGIFRDISKEKESEEKNQIFENINVGIIGVDTKTMKFVIANPEICKITGYSQEELLKMSVENLHLKKDLPYVLEQFEKLAKKEIDLARNIPFLRKDNSIRFCDVGVATQTIGGKDVLLEMFYDNTEKKKIEETLNISENKFRRLFESAQDGILILNADTGMIQDSNPFLEKLLGYSKEELVGRQLWEISLFKDIAANKAGFIELQKKKYVRYEDLPLETKSGRKAHVEFVSNVYEIGKGISVIQCNIRDITDRYEAEELRMRLAGEKHSEASPAPNPAETPKPIETLKPKSFVKRIIYRIAGRAANKQNKETKDKALREVQQEARQKVQKKSIQKIKQKKAGKKHFQKKARNAKKKASRRKKI